MSTNLISSGTTAREKVNLRTPDVMAAVQEQVESHYRSDIVEKIRRAGGVLSVGRDDRAPGETIWLLLRCRARHRSRLRRAQSFQGPPALIVGEIIHNPEVNEQICLVGHQEPHGEKQAGRNFRSRPEDVVIVPAFGTELSIQQQIKERGCQIVDTTCGDVMSVWKRVRKYASESATSIIHGKAEHEETKATSSRALGDGNGHYLVVLTLADTDYVCDYIRHGGDKQAFLEKFRGAIRPASIRTCICKPSASPIKRRCCAAKPKRCSGAFGRRLSIATGRSLAGKEFSLLRHNLRRDAGTSGCVARTAQRRDGPVAGGRRL